MPDVANMIQMKIHIYKIIFNSIKKLLKCSINSIFKKIQLLWQLFHGSGFKRLKDKCLTCWCSSYRHPWHFLWFAIWCQVEGEQCWRKSETPRRRRKVHRTSSWAKNLDHQKKRRVRLFWQNDVLSTENGHKK